jgi:lipopolysaccharide/colanic/teichoic acid biosynthesis glycosyltransferase
MSPGTVPHGAPQSHLPCRPTVPRLKKPSEKTMSDKPQALPRHHAADRALAPARSLRWKRPFDLALAIPLTLLALPLIVLLAVLVRLDSRGPAFYVQERVGIRGTRFKMWKLRSMRRNVSQLAHLRAAEAWFTDPEKKQYKTLADPRITRVGRFLRRTNLDEVPQLFNVLKGDMSLVGPRPAIAYELQFYRSEDFERQLVRPGITGIWQLSDRERITAGRMMELDAEYLRTQSPWVDLKILFSTAMLVLTVLVRRVGRG